MNRVLYWHIISNRRIFDQFIKQINSYLSANAVDIEYSIDDIRRLWTGYIIDLQSGTSTDKDKYISLINNNLFVELAKVLGIKQSAVSAAVSVAKSMVELSKIDTTVDYSVNDDILSIGELNLTVPDQIVVNDQVIEQILRYELISGHVEVTQDFRLSNSVQLCLNPLNVEGESVGMFRNDIQSIGENPVSYIQSLKSAKRLTIYLPVSKMYSQYLLKITEAYIKKYPKSEVLLLTKDSELVTKLHSKKLMDTILITNRVEITDDISAKLYQNLPSFPLSQPDLPPLDQMVNNILADINNPLNRMRWSVSKRGCEMGLMFRQYPYDYDRSDRISDWFAEDVRIDCRVKGSEMSPREAWYCLLTTNPEISLMSGLQQRETIRSVTSGCTVFNAGMSAYLLSRFVQGGKLLDPSAGWGERMMTHVITGGTEYVAWDPNPRLIDVYQKEQDQIKRITGSNCSVTINSKPFEDDIHLFTSKYFEYFDGCLMSPPFFDLELYIGESTSTTRYAKFKDWIEGFFRPMLTACYNGLKKGAYLMAYLPSSWFYKRGEDYSKLPELSQLMPYARTIIEGLGGVYAGSFGYIMGDSSNSKDNKIRETFIWRKEIVKPIVDIRPAVKTSPVDVIHSDSSLQVGTFTRGIEYFKRYSGQKVYIVNNYPNYDTEVICYGCSLYQIPCKIVSTKDNMYELNMYGAEWLIADNTDQITDGVILSNGCNIPELIDIVIEKLPQMNDPDTVFAFDSPGMMALLDKLFQDSNKVVVTSRRDIQYVEYDAMSVVATKEGLFENARMLPNYPTHPQFDAKIYRIARDIRVRNKLTWINK